MTGPRVLVVGSYPPVPVPGAAVTLEEVRRAWAAGDEVTVVSPRLSAAHLAVPVAGLLAGRRLDNVRRVTGAGRLVLVAERGFPLSGGPAALQYAAAAALAAAMRRFRGVRLVQVGDLDCPPGVWALVSAAADERTRVAAPPPPPGVTPLGPPEMDAAARARQLATRALRRLLGAHFERVRTTLARLYRRS